MKRSCKLSSTVVVSLILFFLTITSCVSQDPVSFQREKDFYYGEGQGATLEEAEEAAKIDLVSSALKVLITAEMAKSFELKGLKPYIKENKSDIYYIVYRYSIEDWNEIQVPRESQLRTELEAAFLSAKEQGKKDTVEGFRAASKLLERLSLEGLYLVLTTKESGDILFSKAINDYCNELVSNMSFEVDSDGVFLNDESVITITLKSGNSRAVANMPVSTSWSSMDYETKINSITTNSNGSIEVSFPNSEGLKNRPVELSLSFALSSNTEQTIYLKEAENTSKTKFEFRHFDNLEEFFLDEVEIPGGTFSAGALKHDKKAERKEVTREVTVSDFLMDRYQVTNAMYKIYLDDMKIPYDQRPEYMDNDSYNLDNQPVIGVSVEDIDGYILWLEKRLGVKKRLATEDEWEKAAHGDIEGIYPWGDDKPEDGNFANFNGGDSFEGTSPVGSFEDGKNAFGLYDMAGNVWEWTSSIENNNETGRVTVKGGSWMDGQSELRVSTRRYLDPSQRYSDVGFRLVREIPNE